MRIFVRTYKLAEAQPGVGMAVNPLTIIGTFSAMRAVTEGADAGSVRENRRDVEI